MAQKAANAAERAHNILSKKINWQPQSRTHLVVSDEIDLANGRASPVHFNRSLIYVFPPDAAKGLEDFDNWFDTLMLHEYVHVIHLDMASGLPDLMQQVFGRQFLFFPNIYQPGWLIEGLATLIETDNKHGTGRGQSSLFEMMMRAEVMAGIKPVSQVNLPLRSWPNGVSSYLYGVYFFIFLEDVYGVNKIDELIEEYSANLIPFQINNNSQRVIGKDITELWGEFESWLKVRFIDNGSLIRAEDLVEGTQLSTAGYRTGYMDMSAEGGIYYVDSTPDEHIALYKIQNNKNEKISDLHINATLSVQGKDLLVTQLEYCDEHNIYRDLFKIDRETNAITRLTECARYQSVAQSVDGSKTIAAKIDNGIFRLIELDQQWQETSVLHIGDVNDIYAQIKLSPQADYLLAAVFRENAGWNIEEFDLNSRTWKAVTQDRYIDMYPSYSDDGKSILFSSERSGRYQIYRYQKHENKLQQITRVQSGAFYPLQKNAGEPLYYMGYSADGYNVYQLEKADVINTHPLHTDYNYTPEISAQVELGEETDYSGWDSVHPRWWLPMINITEDSQELGFITSGEDALSIHRYSIIMQYDIDNEWATGNVSYSYANRFAMGYSRSYDFFHDQNSQLSLARSNDDAFLLLNYSLPKLESSTLLKLGVLTSQSSDVLRNNNALSFADSRDNIVGGAVLFTNAQHYTRSISPSDGRAIRLIAESSDLLESDFSGEVYTLDWREYISLGQQHVLALRWIQGWGTDNPESFSLGGEDNDYNILDLISQQIEPVFGRRDYALRGYAEGLPELRGRRMQLASMEWRFPGQLLETGWMAPPVGIIQWSGSVFAESAAAYNESSADDYYSSVGVELQADINLFYGLTSRMRLGFASGLDEQLGDRRSYFMLGASF